MIGFDDHGSIPEKSFILIGHPEYLAVAIAVGLHAECHHVRALSGFYLTDENKWVASTGCKFHPALLGFQYCVLAGLPFGIC